MASKGEKSDEKRRKQKTAKEGNEEKGKREYKGENGNKR